MTTEDYDVKQWPHIYKGGNTPWGLGHNTICRIEGGRAGGANIRRASDGKLFTVGKDQVEKRER